MIGVLLVNVGTPKSPTAEDVGRYLTQFLTDPCVINKPFLYRQLLVRGIIVPFRKRKIAKVYQKIWTEKGSPLLTHTLAVEEDLQQALGPDYIVATAMRYQCPCIKKGLDRLQGASKLIIIPLFPQYCEETTGSIIKAVNKQLSLQENVPPITFIKNFYDNAQFIEAICSKARAFTLTDYDHFLFSFHGLPVRQMQKQSPNYQRECIETAQHIAKRLKIDEKCYTISFQSRLGKEEWLKPYTSDVVRVLAERGSKKILVFSPAFVADCLETIYELDVELKHEFQKYGGEILDRVESVNQDPLWINTLKELVQQSSEYGK